MIYRMRFIFKFIELPKVNTVNKENNILKNQGREQVSYLIRCSVYL